MYYQLSVTTKKIDQDPLEHLCDTIEELHKILSATLDENNGSCVFLFGDCGNDEAVTDFPLHRVFIHENPPEILKFFHAIRSSSRFELVDNKYIAHYYLQMHESWESACRILHMLSEGCTDKCYDEEREHQEPEDVINTKNLSLAIYKSMVKYATDGRLEDKFILYWPKQAIYTYQDRLVSHDVFRHMKENGLLRHWKTARSWNGQDVPMYEPTIIRIAT